MRAARAPALNLSIPVRMAHPASTGTLDSDDLTFAGQPSGSGVAGGRFLSVGVVHEYRPRAHGRNTMESTASM
jgi:hypothetical protein